MASRIHPSACVDPDAEIGADCQIGPFCVVGPGVHLGPRCHLHGHVVLCGPCRIGPDNEFFPFCSIGGQTQDLKYRGEPTHLVIGAGNRFREGVTMNRGTAPGATTVVGDRNNLLAYAHVAHDCVVGSDCVFSNNGTLGGHVEMEDLAILGGLSAVHQFCRIGRMAIIGGCTKVVQDVAPFTLVDGNPAEVRSLNAVGLERNGVPENSRAALKHAFKILFSPRSPLNTTQALAAIEADVLPTPEVGHLLAFVKASKRGIVR